VGITGKKLKVENVLSAISVSLPMLEVWAWATWFSWSFSAINVYASIQEMLKFQLQMSVFWRKEWN